jgi:hypothetical protein
MFFNADLFCVRPFLPRLTMLDNSLVRLEQLLKKSGFGDGEIMRIAGFGPRYLYNIRSGYRSVTPRTLSRVALAIDRLKRAEKQDAGERETDGATPYKSSVAAQYRLALALVASVTGQRVGDILDADPNKRATADAVWLRASQARRLALYVANQYLNVPQAALAKAARMTKSAVSIAMKELEDMRDQPDVARVLDLVEGAFQG